MIFSPNGDGAMDDKYSKMLRTALMLNKTQLHNIVDFNVHARLKILAGP